MNSKTVLEKEQTMAQDSEKRFHSIMDKLFHTPKSAPTSSSGSAGVESTRGTKRLSPESALALVEPRTIANTLEKYPHSLSPARSSQAPLCRPWDRRDLMRRLATFKSMTWFAKPKVVSAVNCARRGWINVDADIIACESCGARLLFSTPSSWTQQQVEKAALVFSLKLDNGHKLLCPWIDNICDETLAQFPPTTPPVLVDKFRERSSALLQLLALPVVSSSAIEYMRNPQLEDFLKQSPMLENGNESANVSQIDSHGNDFEDVSSNLYYQAQKIISLCGWEPRSLPYLVECEDIGNHSVKDVNGQNPSTNNSAGSNEVVEATENCESHKSVVLDCRLCGMSVGLWAFSLVPRPLEILRLVGCFEVNGENNSGTHGAGSENHLDNRENVVNIVSNGASLYKDTSSNLNLTIAGGPPPTKQNYKATISLPVIGRALRAKFSYDSNFRDCLYDNGEENRAGSKNTKLLQEGIACTEQNTTGLVVQSETMDLLKNKQHDQRSDSSINDEHSVDLNHDTSKKDDTLGEDKSNHMPVEGTTVIDQATYSENGTHSITQSPIETAQNVEVNLSQSDQSNLLPENMAHMDSAVEKFGSPETRDSPIMTPEANLTIANGEHGKNEICVVMTSEIAAVAENTGKDRKQLTEDIGMKFDPIRQHRHFCPWVTSTGSGLPGWKQTLSALYREKEHSHLSLANSPSTSSLIKVDDPVASVRKLFTSPVTKRMKHG